MGDILFYPPRNQRFRPPFGGDIVKNKLKNHGYAIIQNAFTDIESKSLISIFSKQELKQFFIQDENNRGFVENYKKKGDLQNLDNIIAELYKRFVIPLYIPVLMLITMLLIIQSKEKVNYSKYRLFIFLFGFLIIIFSESTLRFINTSFYSNFFISLIDNL